MQININFVDVLSIVCSRWRYSEMAADKKSVWRCVTVARATVSPTSSCQR